MSPVACDIHSPIAETHVPGSERHICAGFRETAPSVCFCAGRGAMGNLGVKSSSKEPRLVADRKPRFRKYIRLSNAASDEWRTKQTTMKDQEQSEGCNGAYRPQDPDLAKRRTELVPAGRNRGEGDV